MTIRNRLKLIGLVPITLLLLLSSYFFLTSYLNFEKAQKLKISLTNNKKLSAALLEIGKERGLTAMFMGNKQEYFFHLLKIQRTKTDKTFLLLKNNTLQSNSAYLSLVLELLGEEKPIDTQKYQFFLDNLNKLPGIRQRIDLNSADFTSAFLKQYKEMISSPILENLLKINNFVFDTEISSLISTLSKLYISKENSGLERGLISYYLAKRTSMPFNHIALWNKMKAKANVFDPELINNHYLRLKLQKLFSNPSTKELFKNIEEASSTIQTDIDNGDYTEESIDWFELQTQKITLLSKAELIISNILWEKSDIYLEKQTLLLFIAASIWLLSFILSYLGYTTTKDLTRNIQELEDVLNKAIHEMKSNQKYLNLNIPDMRTINLDTHEGTKEAYKLLEALLDTAKEDKSIALKANAAKSLFLANMSHEIRTPLNGIVGFAEILKTTQLTNEQDEFLSIIIKSSNNLLSIINNILDISKIESNKMELEDIVFNTSEEFESAVETYAVAAAEKNIELNYYLDPMISNQLKGDPTKLKEVIINLLSNAIKFTDNNGQINLVIKKIYIDSDDTQSKINFSIQDDGIGMTEVEQSRIFEAFSQADISVTRKFGGTGLGLTISTQFVELMGGKLEVESTKGHGTTFFFSLALEEIDSDDKDSTADFQNLTFGKYKGNIQTILDQNIANYFEYFGPSIESFKSIGELKQLIENDICESYLIDIDEVPKNILSAIQHIDKSKLIIITQITNRTKAEALNVDKENIFFKPLTLSKVKEILAKSIHSTSMINHDTVGTKIININAKILVAEDNNINQKLIKHILEAHGITVEIANNGLEAFEKRIQNNYDLIFMDIQMPIMDGVEATHEIRDYEREEEIPHVPIIALTANALQGDREKFLKEGMDEYLTKPIEHSELLYILDKFLSDKSTTSSNTNEKLTTSEVIPEIKIIEETVTDDEPISIKVEPKKATTSSNSNEQLTSLEERMKRKILEKNITNDKPISIKVEPKKEIKNKKILIAKAFLLERRILSTVIQNLNHEYEILDTKQELKDELDSKKYDIVFTDDDLITEEINHMNNIHLVTTRQSKEEIEEIIKKYRG